MNEGESVPEGSELEFDELRLHTTGGIIPMEQTWRLNRDGRVTGPVGETRVEAHAFEDLVAYARGADLLASDLTGYEVPPGGADASVTRIQLLRGGEVAWEAAAVDGAPDVPEALWNLIDSCLVVLEGSREGSG